MGNMMSDDPAVSSRNRITLLENASNSALQAAGIKRFPNALLRVERFTCRRTRRLRIMDKTKKAPNGYLLLAFHATFDTIIIAVDERQKKQPSFSF